MTRIDRCLCFNVSFEDLKKVAVAFSATSIAELQEHCKFGRRCRLCHPYVRRMLRTGEVVFDRIITECDEPDRTRPSPCE